MMKIASAVAGFKDRLRKSPKLLTGSLIVITLAFLLYFLKGQFIVATVNGQPILRFTLIRELEKQAGKSVLDSLINKILILQEAKKQNVTVSETEIDQTIKQIEENLTKQGQNLDQLLSLQGITRSQLGEQIKIQKLVEKMIGKDIKISDEEIKEYFEKNKSTFPENAKLEDAKEEIKKQLEQEKVNGQVQPWIQSLRDSAQINYFHQL